MKRLCIVFGSLIIALLGVIGTSAQFQPFSTPVAQAVDRVPAVPHVAAATGIIVCSVCTASWPANPATDAVTGYTAYIVSAPTSGAVLAKATLGLTNTPSAPSFVMSSTFALSGGATQYFSVSATNLKGESGQSTPIAFQWLSSVPTIPTGVTIQ